MCTSAKKDALYLLDPAPIDSTSRNQRVAAFFKEQREQLGLSEEDVVQALGLESVELLRSYESGQTALPMDEIFALTNFLNIPPENVLSLIYEVYIQG